MKRKYKSLFCCLIKAEAKEGMPITRCIIQLLTGIRCSIPVKTEKQKQFSLFDPPV